VVIISQEKSTNGNVKSEELYKPKQNYISIRLALVSMVLIGVMLKVLPCWFLKTQVARSASLVT
jgi:hypothetical protein